MKIKRGMFFIIAIAALFGMFFAGTNEVRADINSISVTPLIDGDGDPSSFHISGEPNDVRELKMSLTNFGDEPVNLKIQPTNATTSSEGKIDFQEKVVKGDYGLKTAFSEMTSAKTIILKHNQTKTVSFQVQLPNEQLYGTVIGGFSIYDINHPNDGHSGVGVYFDGIPTDDNHKIKLQGITPQVINSQPYLTIDLANYHPETIKNTYVQVKIKKNNWYNKLGLDSAVGIQDVTFAKIAPNSKIPIEFNQKQSPIQPGNYLVEGFAKNSHGTWRFKENFHVESMAANRVNQESKGLIYDKSGLYLTIIGILFAVIILVFWGVAHQRR